MADAVIPIMVVLIASVVVAYGLFIRWRIRVHRERREAAEPKPPVPASLVAMLRESETPTPDDPPPSAPAADVASAMPHSAPAPVDPAAPPAASMAEAVAGIRLPETLSPLIDVASRSCTERAAFAAAATDPVLLRDSVSERFTQIGYDVTWEGLVGSARRGATELRIEVFPHAASAVLAGEVLFPSAAADLAAVDIWLP